MAALYIHIPFCSERCNYCDFVSYSGKEKLIDKYIEYLKKEAKFYQDIFLISTIYLGGGTPSLLNLKQLEKISVILDNFDTKIEEFSIELNPESITEEKLKKYRQIGINRLSIGLQSTKDLTLKTLSRNYTYKEFIKAYKLCRKYFDNINIDLMYGLPEQDFQDFESDVKNVISLDPNHISIYELHLKGSNPLKKLLPSDNLRATMYEYLLDNMGYYRQYEISNWSKKGFECKHNICYWENDNYVGLGLSAGGHIDDLRYVNTDNFQTYFKLIDSSKQPFGYYQNDRDKYVKESIIMNLRLIRGLNINKFNKKFGKNFLVDYQKEIEQLIDLRLCKLENNFFKLTKKGIMLANRVYEYFV